MAIQVRRGNEVDFDATKMLPGEWAVSLDTKYVRMCFAPGVCLRMATYEAFEKDMETIKSILAEVRSVDKAVKRIQSEVNENAELVVEYVAKAKEYMEQAKVYAENAEAITGVGIATQEKAGLVKGGDNLIGKDGEIILTTQTNSPTLSNSNAGGLKVVGVHGASEQYGEPKPNTPVDIESVVVSEIKTCGKNLIDVQESVHFHKLPMPLKAGTYTISFKTTGETGGIRLSNSTDISNNSKALTAKTNSEGYAVITMNIDYVANYINISSANGTISDVMLVYGSERKPYEPYTETVSTLSEPITLHGIGEVADVLTPQNVKRKFAELVFDGSDDEGWEVSSSVEGRYFVRGKESKNLGMLSCTQAKGAQTATKNINECYLNSINGVLFAINTSFATLEEWKTHLAQKPMTVVYELAEEVTEELPTSDKIALHSLATFEETTYVSTDSEVEPLVEVEYGTSKVGGYSLEALNTAKRSEIKADELTTAMLMLNQE